MICNTCGREAEYWEVAAFDKSMCIHCYKELPLARRVKDYLADAERRIERANEDILNHRSAMEAAESILGSLKVTHAQLLEQQKQMETQT